MRQSWQKKKKLFGNEIKRLRQKITVSPTGTKAALSGT